VVGGSRLGGAALLGVFNFWFKLASDRDCDWSQSVAEASLEKEFNEPRRADSRRPTEWAILGLLSRCR
jgi:hypothetical protein